METLDINVRAEILNLEVGDFADFPLDRYDYVVSCRTRIQTSHYPRLFKSAKLSAKQKVRITRIKDKAELTA